jgi:hypothetical protein
MDRRSVGSSVVEVRKARAIQDRNGRIVPRVLGSNGELLVVP